MSPVSQSVNGGHASSDRDCDPVRADEELRDGEGDEEDIVADLFLDGSFGAAQLNKSEMRESSLTVLISNSG